MPQPAVHPTQIFLHNAQALRVEYRLDDARLILWWSPLAGESFDCADRNFSNRDDHLDVFDRIEIAGFALADFERCEYDPYHCVLHFGARRLHLAVRHDRPALLLWSDAPLTVAFKTQRYDAVRVDSDQAFVVDHVEPAYAFRFAARLGPGAGAFRHGGVRAPWTSSYAAAEAAPGQLLAIGVDLAERDLERWIADLAAQAPDEHLAAIDAALAPVEAQGRILAPAHPELETLRRTVVRGLHSMIDESGAFRAAIKAIYYLIWVRDAGFAFPYQAAAGWPHKLDELCRLLLANPTTARGAGIPEGRMFAQLINRDYGKYEEDGAYYVVWSLFTRWTQLGIAPSTDELTVVRAAVEWVEAYIWDPERGLFGEHFADETPSHGARDHGWDYAVGKPAGREHFIRHDGQPVVRSYDTYINLLMHSTYSMLAALDPERGAAYSERAANLWRELAPFFDQRSDGLPTYGELLLDDGRRVFAPHWGPARSTYVWALSMPCFAPVADWDGIRRQLLAVMMAEPDLHWINGICSAIAAIDPWVAGEAESQAVLDRVADETARPGRYLPMGGAMPEKFGAPEGNLFHDIRPQGFAMGAWLGAWSSLGLRRLPYGLALRATASFERIEAYPWRDAELTFRFAPIEGRYGIAVDGERVPHSLQVPQSLIADGSHEVAIVDGGDGPLLLRSSVQLETVRAEDAAVAYACTAFGLSELCFADALDGVELSDAAGKAIACEATTTPDGLGLLRFTAHGGVRLRVLC